MRLRSIYQAFLVTLVLVKGLPCVTSTVVAVLDTCDADGSGGWRSQTSHRRRVGEAFVLETRTQHDRMQRIMLL